MLFFTKFTFSRDLMQLQLNHGSICNFFIAELNLKASGLIIFLRMVNLSSHFGEVGSLAEKSRAEMSWISFGLACCSTVGRD